MKKLLSCFVVVSLLFTTNYTKASEPDFSMVGFATLNGGTTGGEGGETVKVTTFADLKRYAEDPTTPYIIQIEGEINTGITAYIESGTGKITTDQSSAIKTTYGEIIKLGSNKTLIGIGADAFINRIGINVQCQSNIIIRNIKFTLQDVPIDKSGENKIVAFRNGAEVLLGDPDCISIQADDSNLPSSSRYCKNIWIDHCEFYNYPLETEHKDRYDGLVDIKNDVQYVTISWCHFHDHSKACLFGKGNSDNYNRTTTLHHNYFDNIQGSRLPLLRWGMHHYYNNYQENCQDGLDPRTGSNSYVESCYFKDTKQPICDQDGGSVTQIDNIFENCRRIPEGAENIDGSKVDKYYTFTTSSFVPSEYYTYTTDATEDIPTIVKTYSGVGKINNDVNSVENDIFSNNTTVCGKNNQIIVSNAIGSNVKIYTIDGKLLNSKNISTSEENISIENKGIYIVWISINGQAKSIKVIL